MAPSATDSVSQLAVLRVARTVLRAAPSTTADEEVPEWLRNVIATQAYVHERIGAGGNGGVLSTASKILTGCLKSQPYLLGVYLDTLTAEDKSGESLVALSAITAFAVGLPQYEGEIHAGALNVHRSRTLGTPAYPECFEMTSV